MKFNANENWCRNAWNVEDIEMEMPHQTDDVYNNNAYREKNGQTRSAKTEMILNFTNHPTLIVMKYQNGNVKRL